ncbi:hypothetical protein CYD26_09960 [Pseudomonas sp. FFUP_PS_473]|uniref:hypothetical protein n=1 Tax=Pseudomonas TaxID=286 RepID=UPI000C7CFD57|nr:MULTISPECIES: hypothetical protein [Pseudomonas]PLP93127.1 hypothetical protein CYD26_09960 [Pseudomonas sp. FFUP_PS_473]
MSSVCLIDTSVFVNLLNVPGLNQDAGRVGADFLEYADNNCTFILPMATILETGNHIAQNGDGRLRRQTAQRFCEAVSAAFTEEPPYRLSEFPSTREVLDWLAEFPGKAGQNKSPARTGEGTSFGDLSIIKEYERCLERFPMSELFIWSLDSDLEAYHHKPAPFARR